MANLIDVLKKSDCGIFAGLITKSGLTDSFDILFPLTLFPPVDDAFGELPEEISKIINQGGPEAIDILNYHIIQGEFTSDDLNNFPSLETLQGEDLLLEVMDDSIFVNDASIVRTDLEFDNGWIHTIDSVLMP